MRRYVLDREYPRMLRTFGIDVAEALRKAGAPEDSFAHERPSMTANDYFAFMRAVGELAPAEDSAIRMSSAEGIEQFSPPLFASYCARDGRSCIERLARYKRLVGPMELIVTENGGVLCVEMANGGAEAPLPSFLVQCEFSFLVNLIRRATKRMIIPLLAVMVEPADHDALTRFLGCRVGEGRRNLLRFASTDMDIPFVSRNDAMWSYFEPELRRRLTELDADEGFSARVHSALVELLPGGESGIDDVARVPGLSRRSLQRRLSGEGTTFQQQLKRTRELLAMHYLDSTDMSMDEIAYLLGYVEVNSFVRAFGEWTGMTPRNHRRGHGARRKPAP